MKHYLIFELEIPLILGVGIPHFRDPIPHMSVTYPSFKGYQLVVYCAYIGIRVWGQGLTICELSNPVLNALVSKPPRGPMRF